MDGGTPLLRLEGVTKHFLVGGELLPSRRDRVEAVSDISFDVHEGEILGIVGESGCGKSTLARCIMRLEDLTSGGISFEGRDITRLRWGQMRPVRRHMQIVFQDPLGSLNPRRRVGSIIADPLRVHHIGRPRSRRKRVHELLEMVGLRAEHADRYPSEFSGGQRQRIGIARALALHPKLLICDEAVSALDVSIQAQIINLLRDLQRELGLTIIFIAHDLSVVKYVSDRIAVMYLGKLMEIGDAQTIFTAPQHPYTAALASAALVPDPRKARTTSRLILSGDVPSPVDPPKGCVFHTRCPKVQPMFCRWDRPAFRDARDTGKQMAACHFPLRPDEIPTLQA